MSVPAQDEIPQRELVYRLALAIDLYGLERGSDLRLNDLLDRNPRSAYSTHVLHNIGARRAKWLLAYAASRARAASPARSDGHSLGDS